MLYPAGYITGEETTGVTAVILGILYSSMELLFVSCKNNPVYHRISTSNHFTGCNFLFDS